MANPQKENGYTPICNELLEVIYSAPFNATQLKIILVICRYTYGFSRKEHSISETFISKAINISKRYISSELNKLVEQKIITIIKAHTDTTPRILELNKHYDEWLIGTINQQVNNTSTGDEVLNTTGEQYINTTGEQLFHQDKQNIKQNIKQDEKDITKESIQLSEKLWELYPNKSGKAKAMKKIPALIKLHGFEKMKLSIEKYIESVRIKRKSFPQLNYKDGSTYFNGGFEDYITLEKSKEIKLDSNNQPIAAFKIIDM